MVSHSGAKQKSSRDARPKGVGLGACCLRIVLISNNRSSSRQKQQEPGQGGPSREVALVSLLLVSRTYKAMAVRA